MRVIPAIDVMGGQVVRLLRGDPEKKTVYSSKPRKVAAAWEDAGADMLHIVDLDAAIGSGSNLPLIRSMCGRISVPVQIAGGLRTERLASGVLDAVEGSRVVLGTMAFRERDVLRGLAARHGAARIVVSADHSGGRVKVNGWQSDTGMNVYDSMRGFADAGFSEFLVTDVGRDGTMGGPDVEGVKKACAVRGARVLASGGVSAAADVALLADAGAAGVILGRALYENRLTVREAKKAAWR